MARKVCARCLAPSPLESSECARDKGPLVLVEDGPAPIGEVIRPGYLVLAHLASGGMGRVFRAHQLSMGRSVALKLLPAGTSHDPELVERFRRETETIAQLASPHTVRAYDAGRLESGELFIAMELLAGRPLDAILEREAPLDPARAVRLIRQVCLSLSEAHERGIVHRDVKPSNIFVELIPGGGEHAKVLDFGLVKFVTEKEARSELTVVRQICGTPAYMAPELWNEGEGTVAPPADVYAIGVTLYKMLAGKAPFVAGSPSELEQLHLHERPPPLGQLRARADHAALISAIVERCLEKKPYDRYASAAEVKAALDLVVSSMARASTSGGPVQEDTLPPGTALPPAPQAALQAAVPPRATSITPTPPPPPRLPSTTQPSLARDTVPEAPIPPELSKRAIAPAEITPESPLDSSVSRFAPPPRPPIPAAAFTREHALLAASCAALLAASWLVPEALDARAKPPVEPRGTMTIESAPGGAIVFLDGAPTGRRTPATFEGLPAGKKVRVSAQLAGYAAAETEVELTAGDGRASLRLDPAFGSVRFDAATHVAVDGRKVDPAAGLRLPVGTHVVTAPELLGSGRRIIVVEQGDQLVRLAPSAPAGRP